MYLRGQGGQILELAEEVGLLDIDAGGGLIQQSGEIGDAVFRRGRRHLGTRAEAVGPDSGNHVRVGGGGHHGPRPLPLHGHRLRRGGGPVIHRGVGRVQAGELTDHGLELEDGLEHPWLISA